jgi:D-alanine-D-alanine ligase
MRIGIVHTFASPCRCHETLVRALDALGHATVLADSEEVPARASELAGLDLVFDQTDTFSGKGVLRPVVRQLLEARGARCVGSDARACFIADDKVATKRILEGASVRTPRWAAAGETPSFPFPRVVKPIHEHMSRGLAVVRDEAQQAEALARLRTAEMAALVEELVPGRELAISVVGHETLPIVEWPLTGDVLDAEAKRAGPDPFLARLDPAIAGKISSAALRAFDALGLSGWARFDLKLGSEGEPVFLEANTKPSLETGSPCLVAAAALGLDETRFIERLVATALARSN